LQSSIYAVEVCYEEGKRQAGVEMKLQSSIYAVEVCYRVAGNSVSKRNSVAVIATRT
jgi:hypothetical protein